MKAMLVAALFAASTAGLAAGHHRAEPAANPPSSRFAVRDVYWRCADGVCTSGKSASRPAIVCAALAKQVGRLKSFSTGGAALDEEGLERCNAAAR